MKLIQIVDKNYILGLWWQIPSSGLSKNKAMLELARKTAASLSEIREYNYVALRTAEQYGLVHYEGELPPKTRSLAAAIRPTTKKEAFLGVFCLDDSWWVCGKLFGMVMSDGDAVFDTKEEAQEHISKMVRPFIGDVELAEVVCNTTEESMSYLTPILWAERPLRPLYGASRDENILRRGVIGALLLLVFFISVFWVFGEFRDRQLAKLARLTSAEREAKKQDILAHPERYFRKVWLDAPTFITAGKQCSQALLNLPTTVNVWMLEEAVCAPGRSLQKSWTHRKGASFVALPAETSLQSPQQAWGEQSLPELPTRPATADRAALMTREKATAALYELTQNLSCYLELNWEPPEVHVIDEETTVVAPWQRGQFDISQLPALSLLETDLYGALSYPGSLLASLLWRNGDLTLRGYIYATVAD
jgi:hypothetical protein